MKRVQRLLGCLGFVAVAVLVATGNSDLIMMCLTFLTGGAIGGVNLLAGPGVGIMGGVDTEKVGDNSELLDLDLSKKVALIRPDDTPMDTLTRQIGNVRKTTSIETGGWAVGTRDIGDTTSASYLNTDVLPADVDPVFDPESMQFKHTDITGFKHIPAGGVVGQTLINTADGIAEWQNLPIPDVSGKVDKVEGKQLSTEDVNIVVTDTLASSYPDGTIVIKTT